MAVSREQNETLTQTGAGTPMGDLFRRYWLPVLLADELPEPDCPPVRVTILGERLIGFRDSEGRIGLLDEFCAHRGVSLWFGRNEECGLRCPYHGWKYDVTGQCVELPSEPEESGMRRRIKLKSYPTVELGEVIWTYMGPPELQPDPPGFEWVLVAPEQRYLSKRRQECNYLQALEGGLDLTHVAILHRDAFISDAVYNNNKGSTLTAGDKRPLFDVKDYGGGLLVCVRRNADEGRYYWRITPWVAPCFVVVPPRGRNPLQQQIFMPIDDENCMVWNVSYHTRRELTEDEREAMLEGAGVHMKTDPVTFLPEGNRANNYLIDRKTLKESPSFTGAAGIPLQDAVVQESAGAILDRSNEHLVGADNAIIILRRALLKAAKANGEGRPIPGLDPVDQRIRSCAIELPRETALMEGARHGLYAELGTDPVTV